ncbi:MAG: membrane dipeptidase [Deltaproteobacteria bacterium]|nr:membrane dipeptidase [Deltaproteobacteria bacterium]
MLPIAKTIAIAGVPLSLVGCASMADRLINGTRMMPPYHANLAAEQLHQALLIVDLHADTMLWDRNLLKRGSYGHVDIPRLQEGNVGLQIFSVVTKIPLFLKLDNNKDRPDAITLLAMLQGWPKKARSSLLERAVYQGEKLNDWVHKSGGALKLITNKKDLRELRTARDQGKQVIGGMLSLEGVQALESDPANLDRLYNLGFRVIGLAHLFDNDMAGSAHGLKKGGLTMLGRKMVLHAQERGMIIDLAHASPQAIDDTLSMVNKPVIVSHTGVRGTCDTVRNLSDSQVKEIASTGGVMGIGLFKYATCGKRLDDTVKAMRYVADLVGVQHVALGSDFDGSKTVVNAGGLVLLTAAMLDAGFTKYEITAIMGDNVLRVLRQTLPDGRTDTGIGTQ